MNETHETIHNLKNNEIHNLIGGSNDPSSPVSDDPEQGQGAAAGEGEGEGAAAEQVAPAAAAGEAAAEERQGAEQVAPAAAAGEAAAGEAAAGEAAPPPPAAREGQREEARTMRGMLNEMGQAVQDQMARTMPGAMSAPDQVFAEEGKDPDGVPDGLGRPSINPPSYNNVLNDNSELYSDDYLRTEADRTIKSQNTTQSKNNNFLNNKWVRNTISFMQSLRTNNFNFITKIIFIIFVYFLLSYVVERILFFYDLSSDIGYIYYTWIVLLIILFLVLPTKEGYFYYLTN